MSPNIAQEGERLGGRRNARFEDVAKSIFSTKIDHIIAMKKDSHAHSNVSQEVIDLSEKLSKVYD